MQNSTTIMLFVTSALLFLSNYTIATLRKKIRKHENFLVEKEITIEEFNEFELK